MENVKNLNQNGNTSNASGSSSDVQPWLRSLNELVLEDVTTGKTAPLLPAPMHLKLVFEKVIINRRVTTYEGRLDKMSVTIEEYSSNDVSLLRISNAMKKWQMNCT